MSGLKTLLPVKCFAKTNDATVAVETPVGSELDIGRNNIRVAVSLQRDKVKQEWCKAWEGESSSGIERKCADLERKT